MPLYLTFGSVSEVQTGVVTVLYPNEVLDRWLRRGVGIRRAR
jgi:hypothetical protein